MKITVENLGKIDKATIEVNDLTILVGDNNSGKTYLTYSTYGALKNWRDFINYDKFNLIADEVNNIGHVKINKEELIKLISSSITSESKNFKNKFKKLFNDKEEIFDNSKLKLEFDNPTNIKESERKAFVGNNAVFEGIVNNEGLQITFTRLNDSKLDSSFILKIVGDLISRLVFDEIFYDPIIITAERLGISLFYKELDEKRNSLVDGLQKLDQSDEDIDPFDILISMSAYYATPIRDHISFTRNFDSVKKLQSKLDINYTLTIIKEMLGAEFKKDNKQDIRFFTPKKKTNKFDIPLHLASSSARCIVDLYFYLKHLAKEGDLLMIDEPESHLTLRNQRLMAKLIASIVNLKIKVFITTHSDFLIKELNNLILLDNDFSEKENWLKNNKNSYNERDRLNFERVNVYQAKNGKVVGLNISKIGIEIPFFDEEISNIYRVSNDLEYFID
ncbi:AAA family ATPase [Chryseobacterium sp.]|uniref:AAA family ATPase n=2 Tax=Chryseobacterium sp. TaxID=1871047 RepID=UPI0035C69947